MISYGQASGCFSQILSLSLYYFSCFFFSFSFLWFSVFLFSFLFFFICLVLAWLDLTWLRLTWLGVRCQYLNHAILIWSFFLACLALLSRGLARPFLLGVFLLTDPSFSLEFGPSFWSLALSSLDLALPSRGLALPYRICVCFFGEGVWPSFWGCASGSSLSGVGPSFVWPFLIGVWLFFLSRGWPSSLGFGPSFSGVGPSFSGVGPSFFLGVGPSFSRLALPSFSVWALLSRVWPFLEFCTDFGGGQFWNYTRTTYFESLFSKSYHVH